MDLLPTADQEAVIASAAEFLAKEMPISSLRERAGEAEAFDRASWQQAARLGWFGLGLPEEQGGVGYTAAEEALLFREIGRHLAPGPFVATVLGAHIAAAAGRDDLVEAITSGEIVVGTAQRRVGARAATGPEASGGLEVVSGDFDLIDTTGAALVAVVEPQGAVLLETAVFGTPGSCRRSTPAYGWPRPPYTGSPRSSRSAPTWNLPSCAVPFSSPRCRPASRKPPVTLPSNTPRTASSSAAPSA